MFHFSLPAVSVGGDGESLADPAFRSFPHGGSGRRVVKVMPARSAHVLEPLGAVGHFSVFICGKFAFGGRPVGLHPVLES